MKDLLSLSIKGLFGRFNYDIDFQANDGFTILAAPNSFGKSTILKIIRTIYHGNPLFFYTLDFEEVHLKLKDFESGKGIDLFVVKVLGEDPSVEFRYSGKTFQYTYSTIRKIEKIIDERMIFLQNVTKSDDVASTWVKKDADNSDEYDVSDVYHVYGEAEYGNYLTENIPWVSNFCTEFLSKISFFVRGLYQPFESTNNIMTAEGLRYLLSNALSDARRAHKEVMDEALARDLSNVVNASLKQFDKKQDNSKNALYQSVLKAWNDCYAALHDKEDRLNVYLLNVDGLTELDAYKPKPADSRERLAWLGFMILLVWNEWADHFKFVHDKMNLIQETLNKMLFFKKVQMGGPDVMKIVDERSGNIIPLNKLSSGEKQIIGVLGMILFTGDESQKDLLTVMDEPETSLHPAWQEELVDFCYKANQQYGMRFIFASHSPIFIGNYTDHMVDLYKQGIEGN